MDSPSAPSSDENELSPVVAKLSKLTNRSSFTSFFCKTKRPPGTAAATVAVKSDPIKGDPLFKEDPLRNDTVKAEMECKKDTVCSDEPRRNITKDILISKEDPIIPLNEPTECKTDTNVTLESSLDSKPPLASIPDSSSSASISNLISISSDSSDSDIQLISESKRARTDDIECISISSDDTSVSIVGTSVKDLKGASTAKIVNTSTTVKSGNTVNSGNTNTTNTRTTTNTNAKTIVNTTTSNNAKTTVPSTSSISAPLTDYSRTKTNDNFFKPPPVEKSTLLGLLAERQAVNVKTSIKTANPAVKPQAPSAPDFFSSGDYDPSLMDELRTRLSQRNDSTGTATICAGNTSNSHTSANVDGIVSAAAIAAQTGIPCLKPSVSTGLASESLKVVTFLVIQRLNPATFDPSKSLNGQLAPSNTFQIHWRLTDTFGAMKQVIAKNLSVSPADLVLVNAQSQSELFDTTKPATLNMNGISLQEITARQLAAIKSAASEVPVPVNTKKRGGPAKKTTVNNAAKPAALTTATQSSLQNLQEFAYRLFLYTKSTWTHFKSLQDTKKRQVLDSVSFLQNSQAEFSKYQATEFTDDTDTFETDEPTVADTITVNVKTAQSKYQSFPLKLPASSFVSDILALFTREYPDQPAATRVVFDGDVLKMDSPIDGILEDDDMIEIK